MDLACFKQLRDRCMVVVFSTKISRVWQAQHLDIAAL